MLERVDRKYVITSAVLTLACDDLARHFGHPGDLWTAYVLLPDLLFRRRRPRLLLQPPAGSSPAAQGPDPPLSRRRAVLRRGQGQGPPRRHRQTPITASDPPLRRARRRCLPSRRLDVPGTLWCRNEPGRAVAGTRGRLRAPAIGRQGRRRARHHRQPPLVSRDDRQPLRRRRPPHRRDKIDEWQRLGGQDPAPASPASAVRLFEILRRNGRDRRSGAVQQVPAGLAAAWRSGGGDAVRRCMSYRPVTSRTRLTAARSCRPPPPCPSS